MKPVRIAVLLAASPLLGGCLGIAPPRGGTTLAEVERGIDEALPLGSTFQEIEACLAARGIKGKYTEYPFLTEAISHGEPWDGDYSGAIFGSIEAPGWSLFGPAESKYYFVLGANGRLTYKKIGSTVNTKYDRLSVVVDGSLPQ